MDVCANDPGAGFCLPARLCGAPSGAAATTGRNARGQSMVKVIDRTPLDQRRSLFVVEVTGRWLLLGSSEGGVQLISELDR